MFSRGQILLEIHDAIAMRTQTWVGKNVMLSRGQILFKNSRCHCYDDTNLGGKNSQCFHEVVLGSYRYTLLLTECPRISKSIFSCKKKSAAVYIDYQQDCPIYESESCAEPRDQQDSRWNLDINIFCPIFTGLSLDFQQIS